MKEATQIPNLVCSSEGILSSPRGWSMKGQSRTPRNNPRCPLFFALTTMKESGVHSLYTCHRGNPKAKLLLGTLVAIVATILGRH